MIEINCCEYCDEGTSNAPERIKNRKVWVCDKAKCQYEFWNEENKIRDAAKKYDAWVTRSR